MARCLPAADTGLAALRQGIERLGALNCAEAPGPEAEADRFRVLMEQRDRQPGLQGCPNKDEAHCDIGGGGLVVHAIDGTD